MAQETGQSVVNLDLSQISSEDVDSLVQRINSYYTQDSSIKGQLSWHWERNQLMLDGKQWLVYDAESSSGAMWSRLRLSKHNEYIPRPVTNYMFDIFQTLKSYMIKDRPRSKVSPNTQEYRDKNAAKLATLILEVNWARLKEDLNYEVAAANLIQYGTVFKKSYWDTASMNLIKVPKMVKVPITDPLTGMVLGESEQQEVDPITHEPVFEELPLGDVNTAVIDPYRICLDPLAMHLHEAKWIMETSIQTLDWIKTTYMKEAPGYTGNAVKVKEDKHLNGSMRRWFKLKTSSGVKDNALPGGAGSSASDTMVENSAIVKEYYERPSAEYPRGRLIVVAGDQCVYSGPSPYSGPEMGDWHPYSECRWEIVAGRFWGKSPLDDAAELQKRLNSIDSAIVLTRKTMAVPQKLIPTGSGIAPGSWTGRPGQEVHFRPDGTGAMPQTIPPAGVDPSVFQERQQVVSDMREISGAIDILRGDRPPGVNAASALNLLYEVGTGKLYPILGRWKLFVESDQKKQLRIIANKYKEQRPDFIRMLHARNSEISESEINRFIGSDLYDNCNVVVEAGSNIPKLQAAKQALVMQLAQMGALNLQNPENQAQFQSDMGIVGYNNEIEPDRKRATWENDLLDNIQFSPDNKPVVLAVDNHDLHIEEHSLRMKSPTFMSLPFDVQQAYMMHIQEHENFKMQALAAQMLQMQAMSPTPGAPIAKQVGEASQPGGQPQNVVQHPGMGRKAAPGKGPGGPTADVKNAINGSDILGPGTLGNGRA